MKMIELIKLSIKESKGNVSKNLLATISVLYYELFERRINYDDESIKQIFAYIIDDDSISIHFYVDKKFDFTRHKLTLCELKYQLSMINFNFKILASYHLEKGTGQMIQLK